MGDIRHIVQREFKRTESGFARTASGAFVVIYGVWDTDENKFVGPMYETEEAALLQAEILDEAV
jgi:hypothetical protein